MVRMILTITALFTLAEPVTAQSVDWSQSGGVLFGRPAPDPGEAEVLQAALGPVRLPDLSQPFMAAIAVAAERHGLDPKLLHALVVVESGYDPVVCSPVGACGLTQLMPGTAADLGVRNRFDPAANLDGGADYLARQLAAFGDLRLALAAFNAGPARVARLGRVPDIRETQSYVVQVVDCYLALSAGKGVRRAKDCAPSGAVQ